MSLGGDGGSSAPHGVKRSIDEVYGRETVDEVGVTEIDEMENFTYFWQIRNFNSIRDEEVQSPAFTGGTAHGHQWHLKAKTTTRDVHGNEWLDMHLAFNGFGSESWITKILTPDRTVKVAFKLSLVDDAGVTFESFGGPRNTFEFARGDVHGPEHLVSIPSLSTFNRLPHGVLNVHCQIWFCGEIKHHRFEGGSPLRKAVKHLKDENRSNLAHDFGNLSRDAQFTDVSIVTANRNFKVHRCILCARSAKFQEIFGASTLFGSKKSTDIPEFSEVAVEAMLDFIYSGEVKECHLRTHSCELIRIGRKFELRGLKGVAELEVAENLSVENAAEMLLLAHETDAETLKPRVLRFIQMNLDHVKRTPYFQTLVKDKPELVQEILGQ